MAAQRWPTLADELEATLEARFGGHLHIAETEAESDLVRERVEADQQAGVAVDLVSASRMRSLAPGLVGSALCGAFTPGDGQANPIRTAKAFAAAAGRHGAGVHIGSAARLAVEAGRVVGIYLEGRRVAAGTVVVAAGAWSRACLAEAGCTLPIRWRGLQMMLSEVDQPRLAPTVTGVGRNLSLKQLPSGQYMLGGGWQVAPAAGRMAAEPVAERLALQWAVGVAVWPRIGELAVAQVWAGLEAQSVDGLPFIGPLALPGLYVATGFSNHGFQISPAVGSLVAADLCGQPVAELAPFRPARAIGLDAGRVATFRAEPVP